MAFSSFLFLSRETAARPGSADGPSSGPVVLFFGFFHEFLEKWSVSIYYRARRPGSQGF